MPRRKKTATNDLPAYVDREKGAFQLSITPEQWDDLVATGVLPPPSPGFPSSMPRWQWRDIQAQMSGKTRSRQPTRLATTGAFKNKPNPFVERVRKYSEYRTAALAQGHSKKEAEKIADDKLNGGTPANMSEEEILEQVRLWLGSSKRGRRPKS
jgi:hypothetical protein